MAKLAKETLRPGLEHQIVLAIHYMFPGADKNRIKQISALLIIYFVFDGLFPLLKAPEIPNSGVQTKSKRLQIELYGKRKTS